MWDQLDICQCVGLPGAFIHRCPFMSTARGRRAEKTVTIGTFCWDGKPGFITDTGEGKPLGFIARDGVYIRNRTCINEIPEGENVSVAMRGAFFAVTGSDAEMGQKVFASLEDGSIIAGDPGEEIEGYVETDYIIERPADEGEITVISNWREAGGESRVHKYTATAEELEAALADSLVTKITLTEYISAEDTEAGTFKTDTSKTLELNNYGITGAGGREEILGAIFCNGGILKIKGPGTVHGGLGCTANRAVWAEGEGKVIINGGSYDVGLNGEGEVNTTIYASGGGTVKILDGFFENEGADCLKAEYREVLDVDSDSKITCKGGSYQNQNPADGNEAGAIFLAEGCSVTETTEDTGNTIYKVHK